MTRACLRPLFIAMFAVASAAAACSLFVDTSDLSGGGGIDASSFDSPVDAGGSDGAIDARALDAGDAGDGCAHTICESFDDGQLATRWQLVESGNDSLAITDAASVSSPYALAADVAPPDGGPYRIATITHSFPGAPSSIIVEFDARLDVMTGENPINIIALTLHATDPEVIDYELGIGQTASSSGAFVYEEYGDGGFTELDRSFARIPTSPWAHVKLAITLGAASEFAVSIDGTDAASIAFTPPSYSGLDLALGVTHVNEPGGPMLLLFDDVTVDVLP